MGEHVLEAKSHEHQSEQRVGDEGGADNPSQTGIFRGSHPNTEGVLGPTPLPTGKVYRKIIVSEHDAFFNFSPPCPRR